MLGLFKSWLLRSNLALFITCLKKYFFYVLVNCSAKAVGRWLSICRTVVLFMLKNINSQIYCAFYSSIQSSASWQIDINSNNGF